MGTILTETEEGAEVPGGFDATALPLLRLCQGFLCTALSLGCVSSRASPCGEVDRMRVGFCLRNIYVD